MSRGLRILVGVAAVLYIGALVAVVYTLAEQKSTDTRIARAEKFDPCVSLSEAVANKATDRIKPLTRECREFLNGIGPLVTIKLSCAIIEKARYICPAPGTDRRESTRGESIALGPALTSAPVAPDDADGTEGSEPPRNGTDDDPAQPNPDRPPPSAPGTPGSGGGAVPGPSPTTPSTAAPGSSPPSSEPPAKPGPVKSTLETVGDIVHTTVCPLSERLLGTCPN